MPYQGNDEDYGPLSHEWSMTYGDMTRELWALVQLAKPIVENDALMAADLSRSAPLPSETWLSDFEAFKKKWMMK